MSTAKATLTIELMRTLSARTIMFHQTVAGSLGVNTTDLKCVDLATLAGRNLTAGELAEASGLTTGAITGVVDRLEKAGLARRERDPHDRRRVIIVLTHARDDELKAIFSKLQRGLRKLLAQFTPLELAIIARFIEVNNELLYQQTLELRRELAKKK